MLTVSDLRLSPAQRLEQSNLYTCILVQGTNDAGQPCYAYFGLFADRLVDLINGLTRNPRFNPKDVGGIVLARSTGEPSPEIREFMRMKFSFSENDIVLELSRK